MIILKINVNGGEGQVGQRQQYIDYKGILHLLEDGILGLCKKQNSTLWHQIYQPPFFWRKGSPCTLADKLL